MWTGMSLFTQPYPTVTADRVQSKPNLRNSGSLSSLGLFSVFHMHKVPLFIMPNYSCDGLKPLIALPGPVITGLLARFLSGIPLMLSSIKQNI